MNRTNITKSDLEFLSTERNESVRFNVVDGKYEGLILEAYFNTAFDDDIVFAEISEVYLVMLNPQYQDTVVNNDFTDYDTDDLLELLDARIDQGAAFANKRANEVDAAHDRLSEGE